MSQKPRIKFLVALWGDRYVKEFARVSLPSYLAAGNIPTLAAGMDLEMLIMTTRGSRSVFDEESIFNRIREYCPVRFIYIDDLIATGVYGVTLTLAFARGIRDSGNRQTETTFIFMNSDFILADGALATLRKTIDAGARCIMAPSLRANSEPVLPILQDATLAGNGVLSMQPREMVQLAFDHLHATVIGKTVTQHMFTCTSHNQIYWQVDSTSLLARYHLIFMLAIKPERSLPPINSYCDYGFVPEMVPSGSFTLLSDSDDFFMLEMQPSHQEKELIRIGHPPHSSIANELSIWTTREHRAFASVEVHFHTEDSPWHAEDESKKFHRYMDNLFGRMGKPVDHVGHFYWSSGYQAWKSLHPRLQYQDGNEPPEITGAEFAGQIGRNAMEASGESPADSQAWEELHPFGRANQTESPELVPPRHPQPRLCSSIRKLYEALLSKGIALNARRPKVPVWHHQWSDFQLLLQGVEDAHNPEKGPTLVVCPIGSPLAQYFSVKTDFIVHEGLDNIKEIAFDECELFGQVLLHVMHSDIIKISEILNKIEKYFISGTYISVFCKNNASEFDSNDFNNELPQYIDRIFPSYWRGCDISTIYAGGRLKRVLRRIEIRLFNWLVPSTRARLPLLIFAAGVWPIVATFSSLNNLRIRAKNKTCPAFCSSFYMTMKPIQTSRRARRDPVRLDSEAGPHDSKLPTL